MMQEKKKLDAMAEKYKEEMMRIYNKKRAAEQPVNEPEQSGDPCGSETEESDRSTHTSGSEKKYSDKSSEDVTIAESCENDKEACKDEPEHNNSRDDEKLMHPPMPKIPYERNKKPEEKSEESCMEKCCTSEEKKFPTAEELINMDSEKNDEKAVPAAAMQRHERNYTPDARFESNGSMDDMDNMDDMDGMNNDGHLQGNYNFRSAPDDEYEKEMEDLEAGRHGRGAHRRTGGQGYLQAEVTDNGDGSPISGATVVVVRRLGDSDSLEAVLTTDSHGMSESITLDVPDDLVNSGMSNGSEPYEEYMITVYKEGYYSVNLLPVPIFDTIKSIQPVEMSRLGNGDPN